MVSFIVGCIEIARIYMSTPLEVAATVFFKTATSSDAKLVMSAVPPQSKGQLVILAHMWASLHLYDSYLVAWLRGWVFHLIYIPVVAMMLRWECWCDVFRHCLHALLDALLCRTWVECVDSLKPLSCALPFLRLVIDNMLSITIVLLHRISRLLGMTHIQSGMQRHATMEKSVVAQQALLDVPHRLTSFVMQEVGQMWKHFETNHLCTCIALNLWLSHAFVISS